MFRVLYPGRSCIAAIAAAVLVMFVVPAFAAETCPADVDADGEVGVTDVLIVLGEWGFGSGTSDFTGADHLADGVVDIHDFLGVLAAWGPCPEP